MSIILEKEFFLENVEQHTLYWFCSIRLPVFSWPLPLLLRQSSVLGLHITMIIVQIQIYQECALNIMASISKCYCTYAYL